MFKNIDVWQTIKRAILILTLISLPLAIIVSGITISQHLAGNGQSFNSNGTNTTTRSSSNPQIETSVTSTPTSTPTQPSSSSLEVLPPQEVQRWCSLIPNGGTCDVSRFVQFRRVDRTVLLNAVQMLTGEPVAIKLPTGFTADVWDCYQEEKSVHGPKDLPRVCTMTVARGTKAPV